eukprot:1966116-Alexandrium_andersonii.AAC.1
MATFLDSKHKRLITYEVCESSFNRQKRMKKNASNRRLEFKRAWGVLLDWHVLDQVNSLATATFDGVHATGATRFPEDVQEPPLGKCSVDSASVSPHKSHAD